MVVVVVSIKRQEEDRGEVGHDAMSCEICHRLGW